MKGNVERALSIVRNFTEAEFHTFMEHLYLNEDGVKNISFNDLIGKIVSKTVSFVLIADHVQLSETENVTVCKRNILNSSMSHNFRLLTSEISQKPAFPMAA